LPGRKAWASLRRVAISLLVISSLSWGWYRLPR
jgi:hypothetical protein